MKTIALTVNTSKENAREAVEKLLRLLHAHGAGVITDEATARFLGDNAIARDENRLKTEADVGIALGGDGTVLKTARLFADVSIPVLGINMGGLGFLTAATLDEAEEMLRAVIKGSYSTEDRMLLNVVHYRGGKRLSEYIALNDAVITKGLLSRTIRLTTSVGDEYLVTFVSDGLIISSPTGSTAYSLSAGGPLVSPDTDAIIVTPICPHTLTNRPLIVPGNKAVRVEVVDGAEDIALTLDGQLQERLSDGDEVVIAACKRKLKLIVSHKKSYFHLLREKLHWGGRLPYAMRND